MKRCAVGTDPPAPPPAAETSSEAEARPTLRALSSIGIQKQRWFFSASPVMKNRLTTPLLLTAIFLLASLLLSCSGVRGNSSPGTSSSGSGGGGSGSGGGSGAGPGSGSAQFVYTADAQSFDISGFQLGSGGKLTPVPGSPVSVPSAPPAINDPLAVAQAGKYLLVESTSPNVAPGIQSYAIDFTTGALTQVNPPTPPDSTNDFLAGGPLAVDQSKMVAYFPGESITSLPNGTSGAAALGAYAVNSDGSLSALKGSPYSIPAETVALDPLGRFVYAIYNGQISVVPRNSDGSLGGMAPGSPMKLAGSPASTPLEACSFGSQAVASPSGNFVYVTCGGSTSLNVFSVDSSGRLASVQSLAPGTANDELSGVALNPAGTLLIATKEAANSITVFSVDQGSGKLTEVATAMAGTRPNSVAFDTSGSFAYVTNGSSLISKDFSVPGSNNLSAYAVSKTGQITPLAGSPYTTGSAPRSVTVLHP